LLHRLEKAGYLESNSEIVNGRVRKYYRATIEGKHALEESKKRIRELVTEVLEDK
jgi:DNA-binding PadR family transcriptional regulator